MPWMNLNKLLVQLRQRQIDPQHITIFIDDHIVDPRYQRSLTVEVNPEDTEDSRDEDSEVD